MFPVETHDKPALIARLAARGIAAVNMWSHPHPALDGTRFSRSDDRRRRAVGLPVHQDLDLDDVERIAAALAAEVSAIIGRGEERDRQLV
jgi:dTDP-4-amino-4,6-dideoxygalactose transaminase